jgi:predicted secreted protein
MAMGGSSAEPHWTVHVDLQLSQGLHPQTAETLRREVAKQLGSGATTCVIGNRLSVSAPAVALDHALPTEPMRVGTATLVEVWATVISHAPGVDVREVLALEVLSDRENRRRLLVGSRRRHV